MGLFILAALPALLGVAEAAVQVEAREEAQAVILEAVVAAQGLLILVARVEILVPDARWAAQVGIAGAAPAALQILICPEATLTLVERVEEVVAGLSKQQAEVAEEAEVAREIRAIPATPVQRQTQLHLTVFL